MAKKVEQLPAQTAPAGSALVVVSESGVSKKSTIDQMQAGLKAVLEAEIDTKTAGNAPITPGTKTKITYDAHGFVTGGTSATTADINDSLNRRYVTDAQLAQINQQASLFDADGNLQVVTTGAGIILKNQSGVPFKVAVDDIGQVVDMSGFVSAKNGSFFLRGYPYQAVGMNYYPLAWSSQATVVQLMDYAVKIGVNEFRFWLFDQLNPSDSGGNFHFLDYALSPTNMVTNGGLDSDASGYTLNASGGYANDTVWSATGGHTSGGCLLQTSSYATYQQNWWLAAVTANTDYVWTFWIKCQALSGDGSHFPPTIRVQNDGTGADIVDAGIMSGDNIWHRKQVKFNSGVATSVRLNVINFGGQNITYLDDFHLMLAPTPSLGYREDQFLILDMVANEARKRGIKLIPSFADNTTNYNTKLTYIRWANAIYGAGLATTFPYLGFFTSTYTRQLLKANVAYVLNRRNTINGILYKNDPTFKGWEIGNELRADNSSDPNFNTPNSYNIGLISAPGGFADDMSRYIKVTLGAKQLVTYGSMSHAWQYQDGDSIFNGSYYGVDYRIMAALPYIGYLDFHIYPTQDALQPFLYPSGERDIVSYGQKLGVAPVPIRVTGSSVSSLVIPLHVATQVGDILNPHLTFSGTPGSTPVVTDTAGNTYTLTSNDSTTYHFNGPQVTGGATSISVSWTTPRNVTFYVDENGGRENANNGRSRAGFEAQLLDFINTGKLNGKATNISEHGYASEVTRFNYHYPLQPRVNAFSAIFDFWFTNGGGSIDLWSAAVNGGGSYNIKLADRGGEAITDNSDDTNINNLIGKWNEQLHHYSPKSELDDDTRYADSELSSRGFDGDYQGTVQLGTSGEALSFGHLVYLDEFTGLWKKAGALLTTSRDRRLGMCLLDASGTGKSIKILSFGNIRADALFPTFTTGKPVFMSETAGLITNAKPTTTGAYQRVVGFADNADQLYFQPDGRFGIVS